MVARGGKLESGKFPRPCEWPARAGRREVGPDRLRQGYGGLADQPPRKLRRSAEASGKAEALRGKAEGLRYR